MFESTKEKKSELSADQLPLQMQSELWHLIFLRQHKGLQLTSPQRFNLFKDPHSQTLSVVHSQAEPYFSDSVSAPYIKTYATLEFPPRIFVYDQGDTLLMTTQAK